MRLGAAIYQKYDDPQAWVAAVKAKGYRAAYCPVPLDASDEQVRAYRRAAERADIVISEVGAWSNPLAPDPASACGSDQKVRASAGSGRAHRRSLRRQHQAVHAALCGMGRIPII